MFPGKPQAQSLALVIATTLLCWRYPSVESHADAPPLDMAVGRESAVVFAYGHKLLAPFHVVDDGDTVRVNGYPYYPKRKTDDPAHAKRPVGTTLESMSVEERAAFDNHLRDQEDASSAVWGGLKDAGLAEAKVAEKVAFVEQLCRSLPQIIDVQRSAGTVTVTFRSGQEYMYIMSDLSRARNVDKAQFQTKERLKARDDLNASLNRGCLPIFGHGYHVSISPQSAGDILVELDNFRPCGARSERGLPQLLRRKAGFARDLCRVSEEEQR